MAKSNESLIRMHVTCKSIICIYDQQYFSKRPIYIYLFICINFYENISNGEKDWRS